MFNDSNGGVTFSVKVVPRASKNQIVGVEGDAIKVRLNAPPVEGKTNDMLIAFLADALGVRRAQVEIVTGHTSRRKVVRVRGVRVQEVERKLMQK
jgi:uncharacterized protein (TIGR00251 family)